jgi:hypothetical protein
VREGSSPITSLTLSISGKPSASTALATRPGSNANDRNPPPLASPVIYDRVHACASSLGDEFLTVLASDSNIKHAAIQKSANKAGFYCAIDFRNPRLIQTYAAAPDNRPRHLLAMTDFFAVRSPPHIDVFQFAIMGYTKTKKPRSRKIWA